MILIQGIIRHQSLQDPLENLTVELWTIQSKNPIKTVKTEEGGHYVFNITDQQLSHIANGASCIEVYLRVLERDVLLAKSQKQALYPSQLPLVIDLEVLMSEDPKNIIKGTVVNAQGKPLSEIWLAAYTYRLGQKEKIAEKRKTDQEGSYLLTYSFDKWADGKRGKANFRVLAFRDASLTKVLAISPLIVDPGVSNMVNFKITDMTLETESTFTALEGKLSSVIAELKGNKAGWNALTSQDVYLLAAELDLETKQIASFIKAQKQANKLGITAATPLIFNLDQQGFNISLGKLLALPTSK